MCSSCRTPRERAAGCLSRWRISTVRCRRPSITRASTRRPTRSTAKASATGSQAYALYRQGFRYWFDRNEILRLSQHNQQFETARSEHELIDEYFRQPVGIEGGEYLPASVILQLVGGTSMKDINATKLGRALTAMGFESKMTRGIRRYRVVRRSTSEMQQHRQLQNVDLESGGVVE